MARVKQTQSKSTGKAGKKSAAPKAKNAAVGAERKKIRFKPGTVALRQIRKLQKTTDTQIPALAFQRLVREIAQEYRADLRFSKAGMESLQEAAEAFLVDVYGDANLLTIHRNKVTVGPRDMQLAVHIRGDMTKSRRE